MNHLHSSSNFSATLSNLTIIISSQAVAVGSQNGIIRRYIIISKAIGPYKFGNVTVATVNGNATFSYTLQHLHPWTSYNVSVQAFTVGSGPKSDWESERTQEASEFLQNNFPFLEMATASWYKNIKFNPSTNILAHLRRNTLELNSFSNSPKF